MTSPLFPLFLGLFVWLLAGTLYAETGRALYLENCASCHGQAGEGLGSNPPLVNSSWIRADPQKLIPVVLNGYAGRMIVNQEEYRGRMPAWRSKLTDSQLASILTYLRLQSGASAITAAEVASVREKSRNQPTIGAAPGCGGGHRGHRHSLGHSMGMGRGCRGCGM
ncbi:cytochrome c [Candidatus Methylacidiphilum infernorum]|uniref:Cytochrome c n=1 Tax=Candidatus Methylacidiphilum infernorum TaxID=511746 RepID=A0ABX7PXF5_9BACT|nr:cytochrome c [Candidatus Methylacidiphilum infernorum]QSR87679.1 cytochrome c [Candidatus Methylacidiphilum infernorum]